MFKSAGLALMEKSPQIIQFQFRRRSAIGTAGKTGEYASGACLLFIPCRAAGQALFTARCLTNPLGVVGPANRNSMYRRVATLVLRIVIECMAGIQGFVRNCRLLKKSDREFSCAGICSESGLQSFIGRALVVFLFNVTG